MPSRPSSLQNPYDVQDDDRPSVVRGLAWGAGVAAAVSVAGLGGVAHADTEDDFSGSWDSSSSTDGFDGGSTTFSSDSFSSDSFSSDSFSSDSFSSDSFSSDSSSEPVTVPTVEVATASTPVEVPTVEVDLTDEPTLSGDTAADVPSTVTAPVEPLVPLGATVVEPVTPPVRSSVPAGGAEPVPVSAESLEASGVATHPSGASTPEAEPVESSEPVTASSPPNGVEVTGSAPVGLPLPLPVPVPASAPHTRTGDETLVATDADRTEGEPLVVTDQEQGDGIVVVDEPADAPRGGAAWDGGSVALDGTAASDRRPGSGTVLVSSTATDDPQGVPGQATTAPARNSVDRRDGTITAPPENLEGLAPGVDTQRRNDLRQRDIDYGENLTNVLGGVDLSRGNTLLIGNTGHPYPEAEAAAAAGFEVVLRTDGMNPDSVGARALAEQRNTARLPPRGAYGPFLGLYVGTDAFRDTEGAGPNGGRLRPDAIPLDPDVTQAIVLTEGPFGTVAGDRWEENPYKDDDLAPLNWYQERGIPVTEFGLDPRPPGGSVTPGRIQPGAPASPSTGDSMIIEQFRQRPVPTPLDQPGSRSDGYSPQSSTAAPVSGRLAVGDGVVDGASVPPGLQGHGVLLASAAGSDSGGLVPVNAVPVPVAPDDGRLLAGQQPLQARLVSETSMPGGEEPTSAGTAPEPGTTYIAGGCGGTRGGGTRCGGSAEPADPNRVPDPTEVGLEEPDERWTPTERAIWDSRQAEQTLFDQLAEEDRRTNRAPLSREPMSAERQRLLRLIDEAEARTSELQDQRNLERYGTTDPAEIDNILEQRRRANPTPPAGGSTSPRSDSGFPAGGVLVASAAVSDSGGILPAPVGGSRADRVSSTQPGEHVVAQAVQTGTSRGNDDWLDQFDDEIYYGPGSRGPLVRDLQLRLHRLGYLSWGEVNDSYGSYRENTADAVRRFQEANGIGGNGAMGPDTANAIQDRMNRLRNPVLGR